MSAAQLLILTKDGKNQRNAIFFFPSQHKDVYDKYIGLCDALISFSESFSAGQNCRFVSTNKISIIFYAVEKLYWIILILNRNKNLSGPMDKEGLYSILKKSYFKFRLLFGKLTDLKNAGPHYLNNLVLFYDQFFHDLIDKYLSPKCPQLNVSTTNKPTGINISPQLLFNSLKYGYNPLNIMPAREPMTRDAFLELQSDIASLETRYHGKGHLFTLLFKRYKSIIWSSVEDPPPTNNQSLWKNMASPDEGNTDYNEEENCLTSNILVDYLSDISQMIFASSSELLTPQSPLMEGENPLDTTEILTSNGKFLAFKTHCSLQSASINNNFPGDSFHLIGSTSNNINSDDGNNNIDNIKINLNNNNNNDNEDSITNNITNNDNNNNHNNLDIPQVSLYRDIWLSSNNYAEPYVLIAYQIYSFIVALIFSKSAIAPVLCDPSSNRCRDFFNLLKMDLNERIGKKYLLVNHSNHPPSIYAKQLENGLYKSFQSIKFLVVDRGLLTFRTNIPYMHAPVLKNTKYYFANVASLFSRMLIEYQSKSGTVNEIVGKYDHDMTKCSFWYIIRAKHSKIWFAFCPINRTQSFLTFNEIIPELEHFLTQL